MKIEEHEQHGKSIKAIIDSLLSDISRLKENGRRKTVRETKRAYKCLKLAESLRCEMDELQFDEYGHEEKSRYYGIANS